MTERETHIDYLVKEGKVKSPEELYVDYKRSYLYHQLSRIQSQFDRKEFPQSLAYLVMVVFTYHYMDMVGRRELKEFVTSLTGWDMDKFDSLSGKSLDEKISLAIDIEHTDLPGEEKTEMEKVLGAAWQWLNLGKREEEEFQRIEEKKKNLYNQVDSPPEGERREIIEFLREKQAPRAKLNLMNLGIVPTEQCVNNCRFCVAAWKPSREERGSKRNHEKGLAKIVRQATSFAGRHKLILTVTGGEPFLEMEALEKIIAEADSRVDITTSGVWASSRQKTEEILSRVEEARSLNQNPGFHLSLQLSLDAFHQEVFRDEKGNYYQNVPLERLINIVEVIREKFPHLELVLLTKLSNYPDPLNQLILNLKDRGYVVEMKDRCYNHESQVPLVGEGGVEFRPALVKGYLSISSPGDSREISAMVFYTVVESMGKALALEGFEYPAFRKQVGEMLRGEFGQPLPILGMEVSDDGNVYPGAHSLYTWSIGNVFQEDLEEIYERLRYDPLARAMEEDPGLIVKYALEAEELPLGRESSPLAVVYRCLEKPEVRLFVTKRLLQEMPGYREIAPQLNIPSREQLLRKFK